MTPDVNETKVETTESRNVVEQPPAPDAREEREIPQAQEKTVEETTSTTVTSSSED